MGTGTIIRLISEDETQELWIRKATPTAADNVMCIDWDAGFPQPREAIEDRTGMSGTRDDTYLHGSSVFRSELKIISTDDTSFWEVLDAMEYWLAPEKRHYVSIAKPDGTDEYRAVYRADPMSFVIQQKGSHYGRGVFATSHP